MALDTRSQDFFDRYGGGTFGLNATSQNALDSMYNSAIARYTATQAQGGEAGLSAENGLRTYATNYSALSKILGGQDISADKAGLLTDYLSGRPYAENALREYMGSQKLLGEQKTQLGNFADQAETQLFGGLNQSLSQSLTNPNSQLGDLNNFMGQQESDVFSKNLAPLINQQLGGQGLLNSGANVELQSKALADLDRQRQANIMNTGLGYKDQIMNLRGSNLSADLAGQQAQFANQSDLQRQSSTFMYQQALQQKQDDLARELSRVSQGGDNMMGQIMGGIGSAVSIGAAPFTGGMSLLGLPASMGMMMGGAQGGQMGAQVGAMGSGFFANRGGSQPSTYQQAPPARTQGFGGSFYGAPQTFNPNNNGSMLNY